MWAKRCKRCCVVAPGGAGNTLIGMGISSAAEVIKNARDMAVDEGKQGVTGPLINKAAKEVLQQEPEPKKSTAVDSAKPEPVTGDEAKQCERRALEA